MADYNYGQQTDATVEGKQANVIGDAEELSLQSGLTIGSTKGPLVFTKGPGGEARPLVTTDGLKTEDINTHLLSKILTTLRKIEFHLSQATDDELMNEFDED